MTRPLAHNQSFAHHCTRTRTFHVHSHIMTGPLAHFDLHITNHSHITVLAHYGRTTRISPRSHIMTGPLAHNQSLAHHCTRTRTFHVHSHIMTGPLAHNQLLAHHRTHTFHIHSHIMTRPLAHFDSHAGTPRGGGAEGVIARRPGDTEGPWVQNCQNRMHNYGLRTPLVYLGDAMVLCTPPFDSAF